MRNRFALLGSLVLGIATATPAHAWEWPEEPGLRSWNPDKTTWAQDILFDVYGEEWDAQSLQSTFAPPPRELWCVENPAPSTSDCQELDFRIKLYLRDDLLELAPNEPLPTGLPQMPPECASICS